MSDDRFTASARFAMDTAIPAAALLSRMKTNAQVDVDTVLTADDVRCLFRFLQALNTGKAPS